MDLMTKVDFLKDALEEEKEKRLTERARREAAPAPAPRTGASATSSGARTGRTSPDEMRSTLVHHVQMRVRRPADAGPFGESQLSSTDLQLFLRPLSNPAPNPFTPLSERPVSGSYSPTVVTYAPAAITYTTTPTFPPTPAPTNYPNHGRYHPYPL